MAQVASFSAVSASEDDLSFEEVASLKLRGGPCQESSSLGRGSLHRDRIHVMRFGRTRERGTGRPQRKPGPPHIRSTQTTLGLTRGEYFQQILAFSCKASRNLACLIL